LRETLARLLEGMGVVKFARGGLELAGEEPKLGLPVDVLPAQLFA